MKSPSEKKMHNLMYKPIFLFFRIFIKYLLHLCEAKVIPFPCQEATEKLVQEILFIALEKKLQAVNVFWIKNGTFMALYTYMHPVL